MKSTRKRSKLGSNETTVRWRCVRDWRTMTMEARRVRLSRPTLTLGSHAAVAGASANSGAVSVSTCKPSRCQCDFTTAGDDFARRNAGLGLA